MGSPAVIAESAFGRDGVSPQPAAAVLRGFQPGDRGYRTPSGAGDRSADPPNRGAPGPAASKLPAAPGLRPVDPRSPRPGSGGDTRLRTPRRLPPEPLLRLGQVASTPSPWRILPGESAANWEAARGTGNPSQGWGQPRALFCQELFGKSRGAARAATPRPRAVQPCRVRRPLHRGGSGPRVEAAAPGASSVPSARRSQP